MEKKNIVIYTDGACRGNGQKDNIGAYGYILTYEESKKEFKKACRNTTNNIQELTAVIESLKTLKESCKVKLYTDSSYVVNAFNKKWIYGWQKNGWKTANKEPVKNKELWLELIGLMKKHEVELIHVRGHKDCEGNNRCDELANEAMDELIKNEGR